MKRKNILFVLVAFLMAFCVLPSTCDAQARKHYTAFGNATGAWDSIAIPTSASITHLLVTNDATGGADSLFVAINNDTTRPSGNVMGGMWPILKGEVWSEPGIIPRFIRTKSSGANIARRIIVY